MEVVTTLISVTSWQSHGFWNRETLNFSFATFQLCGFEFISSPLFFLSLKSSWPLQLARMMLIWAYVKKFYRTRNSDVICRHCSIRHGGGMMPSTLLPPNAKNTAEYTDNTSITPLKQTAPVQMNCSESRYAHIKGHFGKELIGFSFLKHHCPCAW